MKALLALGGIFLALGVSFGIPALSNYADERSAWRSVSETIEMGGYDAALSDSLYQASEATRLDAEWAGLSFAWGWCFLLAGWTPQNEGVTPPRPWRATLIDGLLAWSFFFLAACGESMGAWDTQESAMAAALASAAPALFCLPYAPLLAGRSVGLALTQGGLPQSPFVRMRALLFAPISLPILLLTFWVRGRYAWLKAFHLSRPMPSAKTPGSTPGKAGKAA